MINILATGIMAENNFGSPSIMHGLENLLDEIYKDEYKLILVQPTRVNKLAVSDFKMEVCYYRYSLYRLLVYTWIYKIVHYLPKNEEGKIIKLILDSDIVVDLYGIRFCDNFHRNNKVSRFRSALSAVALFPFEYIAKILGKKTVKNTASYGPMKYKGNQQTAKYACEHIFTVVSAREKMSFNALKNDAKVNRKILLSPDTANLFALKEQPKLTNVVGISVSHQIIKQWSSSQSYIECIVHLCKHVISDLKKDVILIPNEYVPGKAANDIDVANEIKVILQKNENLNVDVADVNTMTSTQLKSTIASCVVMVASRYHACVASLSSGVPLLILGWHYKYQELAELYGQEKWILSSDNCSAETLINTFDDLFDEREKIREELKANYKIVKQKVIETGKELYYS